MAIEKTRKLLGVEVLPALNIFEYETINVSYLDTYTDPDQSEPPATSKSKFTITHGEEITWHDPLVQTIAAAIWPAEGE